MERNKDLRILHIGFPKTGTTWVQEVLLPQVEKASLCDKVIGQSRLSHLTDSLPAMHRLARGVSRASDNAILANIFHSKSFFVSAETFLGDSPLTPRDRALAVAAHCPTDITVLITVRGFSDLLSSLFQEQVKTRLYTSESQFLKGSPVSFHAPAWNLTALNLVDVVKAFSDNFERVVVLNAKHLSGLDWLAHLGFSPDQLTRLKSEVGGSSPRKNASLSSQQVRWILKLNKVITRLGSHLNKQKDARERFASLDKREKLQQLPTRIGISLKVLGLVPLLQKFPGSTKFQISADLPPKVEALKSSWDEQRLIREFRNNPKVLLML